MKSLPAKKLLSLTLFSFAALTGCDGGGNTTATNTALQWSLCEEDSRLECATLQVPMVHSDPTGESITIALNRLPASSADRRGSLLFNPGGPGGSGTDLLLSIHEQNLVPETVRASYDLIGFDPRGVNKSTPVNCMEYVDENSIDYPTNIAELQAYQISNKQFVTDCVAKYGTYLQHLGSADVVDDMELIRLGLGEPDLNFIGYSYGTRLAALYAQTYPSTTGRMVLDASVAPSHGVIELFEGQLAPHENNLELFAAHCESHSNCDPVAYKQQVIQHILGLIENEDETTLEIVALALLFTVQQPEVIPLVSEPFYNYMQTGDISGLVVINTLFMEDSEESHFDSSTPQRSVICADDENRPTVNEIEALRDSFNEQSDLFAELQLIGAATCMDWPQAVRPLATIAIDTAPELLVIAGPADSQTPAVWSERMAQALGARYLLSEHLGHTTVFSEKNACTEQLVEDYLLDGVLPSHSYCPQAE